MAFSIGVDIGGTKVALGLVDRQGRIVSREQFPTPPEGREALLRQLILHIGHLLDASDTFKPIDGIGVGTAGQIDQREGVVVTGLPTIRDWADVPIKALLQSRFSLPTWVENDANAALLSERMTEAVRRERHMLLLTLGTGVGGAVLSNGELLHGTWGAAAELGHMSIDRHGPPCLCGSRGCLELYASGTGLVRMMREAGGGQLTSEEIFRRYHLGDPRAAQVIEEMIDAVSLGIVNLIHLFNPETVILGGGLMEQGDWLVDAIKERVKEGGIPALVENVNLRRAFYGKDAGIVGAAGLVWFHSEGGKRDV